MREWFENQNAFEWVEPSGGVVGLARVRPSIEIDVDRFYACLLEHHGTYVGRGRWFDTDDRYFRLGFGWPSIGALRAGLDGLSAAARETVTPSRA